MIVRSFDIPVEIGRTSDVYDIGQYTLASYSMFAVGPAIDLSGSGTAEITPEVSIDGQVWTALDVLNRTHLSRAQQDIADFVFIRFRVNAAEAGLTVRVFFKAFRVLVAAINTP